ncbi:hypothetical protein AVEN_10156-1 [Araneus ventricosus]|uniref:F-box domain-containing protein n=1 Tax=Araneus ventricosus TaxID=182803 RepID=A0A4Y2R0Z3_ARAVE|nr:hypothetical protein AVEN_10156-1 [Araneus ventricosus]
MVARQSAVVQTVKNCQTLVLSKLILYYCSEYTNIEDFRGLTSTDWGFLKQLYPDLQVELILTTYSATRRELEFFIVSNMPITRLDYMDERNENSERGIVISELFVHLLSCQTNDHLVTLRLVWQKPIQHLSSTFIPFLQACKKLKILELIIYSPTSGVDVLLESWMENRPESLEKVIIDVSYIRNGNNIIGWIKINIYVFLLKKAGLNINPEIVSDANAIEPIGVQYTEEKRESETVQSIASNDTEECEKQGKWSELPSLPLENIYSFLRREDQVNMSLVCRSWSEGYSSPSVWKTFRFYLTDSQLTMDSCPVMEVVKKYSNMFRHVEIESSSSENNDLMRNFCRHVIQFLQILTRNSQLNSVVFRSFLLCLIYMNNPPYYEICRAIADFLSSQRHLKRVEFHYCFFRYQETVEILRNIIENRRKTLTHLKLRGFSFDRNEDIESNAAQKLPILADLPSLRTLDTDYSFIFEKMFARQSIAIQTRKNCQTLVFTKLILEYDYRRTEINVFRGLTLTDWRFMKKLCPDLQVELILKMGEPSRREMEFFIVPNMPITRLDCEFEESDMRMEIVVLFDHLLACKTNEHLVYLKLEWEEPTQHLSSTFISFLKACKKLKCLVLITYSPISGIDVLLESWLENRPDSLEKVLIDILYLQNRNDFPGLINITEYVSRLKLAGLNIRVNIQ